MLTDGSCAKAADDGRNVVRSPAAFEKGLATEKGERLVRADALLALAAPFKRASAGGAGRGRAAAAGLRALALEPGDVILLAEDAHAGLFAVVDPAVRLEVRNHALAVAVYERQLV